MPDFSLNTCKYRFIYSSLRRDTGGARYSYSCRSTSIFYRR